jgi:hypothetical protein
MARLVINMGLNLATAASTTARNFFQSCQCFLLANSTIRIPFFVTNPISMIIPIWENILMVWLNIHNDNKATANANGTDYHDGKRVL